MSAEALAPTLWLHRAWRWRGRGLGGAPERVRLGGLRAVTPAQDSPGDASHPAPFLWCDGSSPNPVRSLEMATETLVAMVILNGSDSHVALLRQPHPQPLGGNAGTFFLS